MKRIQRHRAKGWRMPANTVYVGRPSRWGNPFPIDYEGEIQPWLALALGERGDLAGRRAAAVKAFRAWMLREPLPVPIQDEDGVSAAFEYADGTVRTVRDIVVGMGVMMLGRGVIHVPIPPSIDELRGKDVACWCPLDQPCHADVLLELLASTDGDDRAQDELS